MTEGSEQLIEVHIRAMPLDVYRRSSAHHDELFREFALVLARPASDGHEVPAQLLKLVERLNHRFSSFTASPDADVQAALNRGEELIDLVYRVPADVKDGAVELSDLLSRADEYCKHGDLLTVAPPREAVQFREWFLGEFINQVDGLPATPWPEYIVRRKASEPS